MSPGLTAWPLGMFSVDGHDGGQGRRQPELGDARHRLDHGGAARHVELHLVHLPGGLDRDPAGVEGHRLAHVAEVRSARVAGPVAEHDQPRLDVRALGDGGEARPCREPRSPRGRAARPRAPRSRRRSRRALGQEAGGGHVGGQVLQVARGVGGLGRHAGALQRRVVERGIPAQLQRLEPAAAVVVALRLEAVEGIEAEQRCPPRGRRPRRRPPGSPRTGTPRRAPSPFPPPRRRHARRARRRAPSACRGRPPGPCAGRRRERPRG